jgi:transcriptional regulator with XRE-family HTH domain
VTVAERLGATVAEIRGRAGLSQGDVAERAGLHPTAVGLIERGERTAQIDTLVRLAGALEVEAGDLLRGIEWVPPPPRKPGRFDITDPDATL